MESIAVMGAGAVGGFYGALLARAGRQVSFIARGAHLAAMRERGLTVAREGEPDLVLREVVATGDPAEIGPVDLVLFTPKTFDLEGAARSIAPLLRAGTLVLPLLNGLDIADRLAAVVGRDHVLAGLCQISSTIEAPGLIRQSGPLNRVVLGEMDGEASARAKAVAELMQQAGINARASDHMAEELWKKFYFLDPWAGLCAMTDATLGAVREDPHTRAVLIECLEEVHALARARGVALPAAADALAALDRLPPAMTPSLLRALRQGAPLEIDVFPGTAVRLGEELGIPTPAHRFIYAALVLRAGGRAAGEVSAARAGG
jgi:2-dehydropantoate 2-reductase